MLRLTHRILRNVSVEVNEMIQARVHLGHAHGVNNPAMSRFIYEKKHGLSVIDLDKTAPLLQNALDMTRSVAANGGIVLFVGTRSQFEKDIRMAATKCGEYYVSKRWIGGCLTNSYHVLGGTQMPDLTIFFSLPVNQAALKEVRDSDIPTIGIVDTDCDPTSVDYPVPANDDSKESISFLLDKFTTAVLEGKEDLQTKIVNSPQKTDKSVRYSFEEFMRQKAESVQGSPEAEQRYTRVGRSAKDLSLLESISPEYEAWQSQARAKRDVDRQIVQSHLSSNKNKNNASANDSDLEFDQSDNDYTLYVDTIAPKKK
eukprot:m.29130 g.29130  ORF g.29130 m.29130 type:complete len:314 (-) comp9540_c0_seq2:99-1040(-)